MKQKRKIFERIIASLMFFVISLPSTFNGKAQILYRGFIEGSLGASIISGAQQRDIFLAENTDGFRNSNHGDGVGFNYMLATTHGIQLKNNFFGIGLGITSGYCAVGEYYNRWNIYDGNTEITVTSISNPRISKVCFPVYLNWRYDFFNTNGSFKPYVGIKAGLYIPISKFEFKYNVKWHVTYDDDDQTYIDDVRTQENGSIPFVAIDFGVRKRISDSSGISLGLSIQTSNNAKACYYDQGDWRLEKSTGVNILANIAFDF